MVACIQTVEPEETARLQAALAKDGVVCVKGLFETKTVGEFRAAYDRCWARTRQAATEPNGKPWQRRLYRHMDADTGWDALFWKVGMPFLERCHAISLMVLYSKMGQDSVPPNPCEGIGVLFRRSEGAIRAQRVERMYKCNTVETHFSLRAQGESSVLVRMGPGRYDFTTGMDEVHIPPPPPSNPAPSDPRLPLASPRLASSPYSRNLPPSPFSCASH